jgi:hypothetical protein
MFSTDDSQGELRVAACLSGDEAMLAAYLQGLDLHAVTGAAMMGMEYEEFAFMGSDPANKTNMEVFELGRYKAKAAIRLATIASFAGDRQASGIGS